MQVIPFLINDEEFSLFVALEQENLDRMKSYDPAEIAVDKIGEPWASMKIRDIVIGWATPADLVEIKEMAVRRQPIRDVLQYMCRGFAFRPDRGDSADEPSYKSAVEETWLRATRGANFDKN